MSGPALYLVNRLPLAIMAWIRRYVYQWFYRIMIRFKELISVLRIAKDVDSSGMNESLEVAGYTYDPYQDIFYSIIDPWQRDFGYCRLYDEMAAPFGMIVDCEPIYFEYGDKKWLIEFWKGQYDLTTGCEIGVYTTKGPDLNIPGVFNGTFYNCANSADFLQMSYTLRKNGNPLFIRKDIHWWLTGFRLGEFSETSELSMFIKITLKDIVMRDAFMNGLKNAGYAGYEIAAYGNSVNLVFNKPHTPQPLTRTKATDSIIQEKNKILCEKYKEITRGCITFPDKLKAIREKAPEMLVYIVELGKPKQLYSIYEMFKKYLD